MLSFILFWLAKVAVDGLVFIPVIAIIFLVSMCRLIKRVRCKHGNIWENRACDAICGKCGKNLGFIGTWRSIHDHI